MFKGFKYFFKTCWSFNKKYIICLSLKQVILFCISIASLVFPKYILDSLFQSNDYNLTVKFIVFFVAFTFLANLGLSFFNSKILIEKMETFKYFQLYLSKKLANIRFEQIESEEYLNIKSKAERYLYGNGSGFASVLENSFDIMGKILTLLGVAGIISRLSFLLLIAIFAIVTANALLNIKIQKRNIKINLEKSVLERRSSYLSNIFQDFTFGKEIRTYNISDWLIKKYNTLLIEMQKFYKKIANNNLKLSLFSASTSVIQQIVSYLYVIKETIVGNITVGTFTMYLSSISTFSSTLKDIVFGIIDIQQYSSYYEAFETYINLPEVNNEDGLKLMELNKFSIEFKNVYFRYPNQSQYALTDINVVIRDGERISIVGMNGAGKTTFIKLLLRIYKPTKGAILLNGVNVQDINYNDYIKIFSTVFQDFKLFSFSLIDNITFSDVHEEENVKKILQEVGLSNKVEGMVNGVNTIIYKDFDRFGYTPSGGEAQKIAMSRALYKDSNIIILDEPTAALDPKAEYELYKMFNKLFDKKTCIFISHRLSSTKLSNKIMVFDSGKFVESGTHEELINKKGLYYELYSMQSQYYN